MNLKNKNDLRVNWKAGVIFEPQNKPHFVAIDGCCQITWQFNRTPLNCRNGYFGNWKRKREKIGVRKKHQRNVWLVGCTYYNIQQVRLQYKLRLSMYYVLLVLYMFCGHTMSRSLGTFFEWHSVKARTCARCKNFKIFAKTLTLVSLN